MTTAKPTAETCIALIRAARTDLEKLRAFDVALKYYSEAELHTALNLDGKTTQETR